jgi:hypothetical protein
MMQATDYARLTRGQARAVLVLIALAFAAAVAVTLSPLGSTNDVPHPGETSDVLLYRAEVDRIRHGEGYYQAAAAELTARGYPTLSVFNWRMPLPMWLLGKLPTPELGKAFLGAMALLLMAVAFEAMSRETNGPHPRPLSQMARGDSESPHPRPLSQMERGDSESPRPFSRERASGVSLVPIVCLLLLTGPLLPTVLGNLFVMPVLWAGVLVALSVCCYGVGRPWLGVAFGLTALLVRELALPYCLLCAAMAWRQGHRREVSAWMLGLLAWLAIFALHWWQVSGLIAANAHAHREGWIQWGGAGFVISTAQMNAYLLLLPQWLTALYLVAAIVGIAGWSTPLGTRVGLTTCLFLIAFAVVGQRFNQYWGCLIGPLLCFGVVRFPVSFRDLWHRAVLQQPCRLCE